MARYQINHYVDTPFGKLHIFADPAQLAKASELINKTPSIIWEAWKDAANRYGKEIIREARRCIDSGKPPKGASWPPLSKRYVENMGGDDRIYIKTVQYYESIGIHEEPVYNQRGGFVRNRYYIGLPNGVNKTPVRYKRKTPITLQNVAKLLEEGIPSNNVPPRPLWNPLFEAKGGKKRIQVYVTNAIKRQLTKYMII